MIKLLLILLIRATFNKFSIQLISINFALRYREKYNDDKNSFFEKN